MKANHIYLRRLRDKDFVDRFEEEIVFRPTTMKDVANACLALSKEMQSKAYQPTPNFEKGCVQKEDFNKNKLNNKIIITI